ncbi:MAG: transporter, family, fosmidomycin resistance protein [Gaiellales bacterium]|nr:transporter, family, fosmidomycin resistance protein [Gaiellales bacterium]
MSASAVATPSLRRSLRPLGLLTSGHLVTDLAQGSVPALLPFLRSELHLSYTRTAAIMLAATVASSVVQPVFGHVFDTRRGEWLLVAGPALAGLGIGALAFAHSFATAMLCVLASSIGVAAFHPEASKFAAWLSGARRSTAMAVFSVGGNLGVALGPLAAGVIAAQFGLRGVWLLAIPGLAVAGVQLAGLAALGGATAHARVATARAGRDRWSAMGLLLVALTVRGYVHFGLLTFIPLLEHDARHNSRAYGSRVLALMLFAGALGTLLAGPLADRYGRRQMLTLSFLAGPPGSALYLADNGILGLAGVALAGAGVISTFGITIVLSQEYLPARLATAAGLSIGLSIGLGGVASFGIGTLADAVGLVDAMWTLPAAALLGAALCALLPPPDAPQRET